MATDDRDVAVWAKGQAAHIRARRFDLLDDGEREPLITARPPAARLAAVVRLVALALLVVGVPAAAETPAQPTREATLDRLLGMLKVAPDEQSAGAVERSVQGQWIGQATAATKLLLLHGFSELNDNHPANALDDFDAALDLQPELQEGWRGRGLARAQLGDPVGATRDFAEVMKREPRQFEALQDLSHVAEQRGDWKGALDAWTRALDLSPKTPGGADRLKELKQKVFGQDT